MDNYSFVRKYYGNGVADAFEEFLKSHGELLVVKSIMKKLHESNDLNEVKRIIDTVLDILRINNEHVISSAFTCGVIYGKNHPNEKVGIKPSKYCMKKDLMIVLDFGDNDFGEYLKQAAKHWCDLYNSKLSQCTLYDSVENMLANYQEEISFFENIDNVSKILFNGFIESYFSYKNDIDYKEKIILSHDKIYEEAKHCADEYLQLLNTENYKIGTVDEMTNYVLNKYKDMQSEGEGTKLENTWLNGEVLFIQVKDGYAKSWVQ